jgi:plasmid stability protein
MATLVIRNLDPSLYARLKARAAPQGRSIKEESRVLLRDGLAPEPAVPDQTLGAAMRALFGRLGGMELTADLREYGTRPPPDLSGPDWDKFDIAS